MLILFKTCCVNAATCISLHDTILKSLFLHFSDIFEDKLDTTMERKKELEASNLHSIDGSNVHSPEPHFEYHVYDCDDVSMELVHILDGGYTQTQAWVFLQAKGLVHLLTHEDTDSSPPMTSRSLFHSDAYFTSGNVGNHFPRTLSYR